MSRKKHTTYPSYTTYYIKEAEFLLIHLHNTCNNRSKSSYNWDETCNNNCTTPMLFIKLMSLLQIALFKKHIFFPLVHGWAYFSSKPISSCISNNTSYRNQHHD